MRTIHWSSICLFSLCLSVVGETGYTFPSSIHQPFDAILKKHVRDGLVDYGGLKHEEKDLDAYLETLRRARPSTMDRKGQLAFWINAYNAFTLKLILNHYPGIESIKDIPSSKRWKAKIWEVDGRRYSLDQIEHDILRKMGEPRIHFAIVCASYSCPDILREAYTAERLEEQLVGAVGGFLADSEKGLRVSEEEGLMWGTNYTLYISPIFRWFKEDFIEASGSIIDFILPYVTGDTRRFISDHRDELKVKHLGYDWRLNDNRAFPSKTNGET